MNHTDTQCRVVSQNGRVTSIRGDVADIQIVQTSACASCRIKGICAAGDTSSKIVHVRNTHGLVEGMAVRLDMAERYGWLGVLLAFVVPLVIVVGALFSLRSIVGSEEIAALVGFLALAPYYGVLYLTRDYFIRTIQFTAHPVGAPTDSFAGASRRNSAQSTGVQPTFSQPVIRTLHKEGVQ